MSDEFDIYGDDTFDQSDDILNEIVGESPSAREAKRRKTTQQTQGAEDDLFADFGEIDKDSKSNRRDADHRSSSREEQSNYSRPTTQGTSESLSQRQNESPQKIPSAVHGHSSSRSHTDSPSRREPPMALANLRGVVSHPTTSIYVGELAWKLKVYINKYVTDEDIKAPLVDIGIAGELKDLTFFEHKVNGKSRGIVFLEFSSAEVASRAKEVLDDAQLGGRKPATTFTTSTNPFKHLPKEPPQKTQRMQTPNTRMGGGQMMAGAAFNPMMGGAFGMPYGGFPNTRGGFMGGFGADNMMGAAGGRGRAMSMRGNAQGQQYMNRMGRGGNMMGGGNYMADGAGFSGMVVFWGSNT
ncbi:hypothetical protein EC973_009422 [Apophysomyces ossiformis]|uniref:RRM domain-containing protein n=1 Tax=Apophysomyces ossiformis TaxID=679940 RepID=A0A8H7BSF3_9FUNG|nr:hypothetical protein EC973_009422 [Apophysomyces ossiformis]